MARSAVVWGIVLTLVVGTVLFFPFFPDSLLLILAEQGEGTVLHTQRVDAGDPVVFNWIHSFELIPWIEEYTIEADGSFLLHTITVAGFGAGIPANKGVTHIEAGMVVMDSIGERFDHFEWIHSQTALTSITVGGRIFINGADVEHHLPVELLVKGTENLWQRFRWTI
ncbi:MAG TPA: DUF1850 domain-containing protein [Sphaerochaeta sp.]|nr:DUF1850 domain-containing protein [Sphaerochaeta sp.]